MGKARFMYCFSVFLNDFVKKTGYFLGFLPV